MSLDDYGWFKYLIESKRKKIEKHFAEVQTLWAEVLSVYTRILDPYNENLAIFCMSPGSFMRS